MGLHSFDDVDHVFDLVECPITDPRVVAAWRDVRSSSELLPSAYELRGTVRLAGNDLVLILEGGTSWPRCHDFSARTPVFSVIRWKPDRGSDRVIADRRTEGHPAESFDQVNQPVAVAARNELVARALADSPRTAIDAYAGLGQTSMLLAAHGVNVTAIESDAGAAQFAGSHLPSTARMMTGRVEDVIARVLPADVVILNPPRAGVDARVTNALEETPPRQLLYMSCDAATLARDVSRLGAYRVVSVRAYDMFPQTAHVEVVCALVPEVA
jgi:23S rRNA (uracil1939-C5)-methyltransferase